MGAVLAGRSAQPALAPGCGIPGGAAAPGLLPPDEVVVHTSEHLAADVVEAVRHAAATAGRLLFGDFPVDFPLDVAVVRSWADAG